MATKRTRSTAQRVTKGSSSNVTDYMGPSKRQKRSEVSSQTKSQGNISPRVNRSGTIRKRQPAKKPVETQRRAPQSPVPEENDDDEPVNINFNTVVSASNKARRSRLRTVNGVHIAELLAVPGPTESDGEGNDEPHNERQENGTDAHSAAQHLRRRLPRPLDSTSTRGPNQHTEQQVRRESNVDINRGDLYEFQASPPESPAQSVLSKPTVKNKVQYKTAPTPQSRPRQQHRPSRHASTVQRAEQDDASSEPNEDGAEGAQIDIGEDSAFIEAPRPDEELATVEVTINSIGGMIGTLAHPAWTGSSRWHFSFDRARGGIQDDSEQCRTALGRGLMKHAKDLKAIFDRAAAAAIKKGDEDYGETVEYLGDHSAEVGIHLAAVDALIEKISTDGLANIGEINLTVRAIKVRRALLRDVARRLIPMIVLIIQATCSLSPSEVHGGKLHMQLSSFTLQFLLRSVGWARRLERALTRGLEHWPFDPEFRQDGNHLDKAQIKSKHAKQQSRIVLERQLSALHYKVKEAERAMQNEMQEAAREELQERRKDRQLRRERALFTAKKNFQAVEAKRREEGWVAFCQSIEGFKNRADPMREKWEVAERPLSQRRASTQGGSQRPAQFSQTTYPPDHPRPSREVRHGFTLVEGSQCKTKSTQTRVAPNGVFAPIERPEVGRQRAEQEAWGLDWTQAEEKTLLKAIKYDQDYEVATMAEELCREPSDVAKKAAALKKAYRDLYREKGRFVPVWAL